MKQYWHIIINQIYSFFRASLVTQTVKNPPAMQEALVQSLGQEDPLEKGMAIHYSIPAWKIPWTEEPGGLQSMRLQTVGHNWVTKHFHTLFRFSYFLSKVLSLFQNPIQDTTLHHVSLSSSWLRQFLILSLF